MIKSSSSFEKRRRKRLGLRQGTDKIRKPSLKNQISKSIRSAIDSLTAPRKNIKHEKPKETKQPVSASPLGANTMFVGIDKLKGTIRENKFAKGHVSKETPLNRVQRREKAIAAAKSRERLEKAGIILVALVLGTAGGTWFLDSMDKTWTISDMIKCSDYIDRSEKLVNSGDPEEARLTFARDFGDDIKSGKVKLEDLPEYVQKRIGVDFWYRIKNGTAQESFELAKTTDGPPDISLKAQAKTSSDSWAEGQTKEGANGIKEFESLAEAQYNYQEVVQKKLKTREHFEVAFDYEQKKGERISFNLNFIPNANDKNRAFVLLETGEKSIYIPVEIEERNIEASDRQYIYLNPEIKNPTIFNAVNHILNEGPNFKDLKTIIDSVPDSNNR